MSEKILETQVPDECDLLVKDITRTELEELIYQDIIQSYRCEEIKSNLSKYRVTLQNYSFTTVMTDDELKKSISWVIDIMEELKRINNNGITRKVFQEKDKEIAEQNEDYLFYMIELWKIIETPKLLYIIEKLDKVRRVGGAYAMLLSNPCFQSAVTAVFDQNVDKFDDEKLYVCGTDFLVRAAMRMNSYQEDEV